MLKVYNVLVTIFLRMSNVSDYFYIKIQSFPLPHKFHVM